MSETNIEFWGSVQKTDPRYTKKFNRAGGFAGTAINATYLAKRATERFGMCGRGWGIKTVDERIDDGAPILVDGTVVGYERVHSLKVILWYVIDGEHCEIEQYGATTFVGKNSRGLVTNEEFRKMSMTDGFSKCMTYLGFASDVHLGLYDDNKYVNSITAEFAQAEANKSKEDRAKLESEIRAAMKATTDTAQYRQLFLESMQRLGYSKDTPEFSAWKVEFSASAPKPLISGKPDSVPTSQEAVAA